MRLTRILQPIVEEEKEGRSICIMVPLPEHHAKNFPSKDRDIDKSKPHITVLFVGDLPRSYDDKLIEIVEQRCRNQKPFMAEYGGFHWFPPSDASEGDKYAGVIPITAPELAQMHTDIWDTCKQQRIPVEHSFPEFNPHVTVGYFEQPHYDKPIPQGRFEINNIDIWGLDSPTNIKFGG